MPVCLPAWRHSTCFNVQWTSIESSPRERNGATTDKIGSVNPPSPAANLLYLRDQKTETTNPTNRHQQEKTKTIHGTPDTTEYQAAL
ncbi:hypothetical protein MalM14_09740 [Gimesia chilikensis]|nr:hypothetical protein MalM14_09740 [Gimesia chilikensis]